MCRLSLFTRNNNFELLLNRFMLVTISPVLSDLLHWHSPKSLYSAISMNHEEGFIRDNMQYEFLFVFACSIYRRTFLLLLCLRRHSEVYPSERCTEGCH